MKEAPVRGEYALRGTVVVATPQANTTVEPELSLLLPPDVGLLTVRLHSAVADPRERLADYLDRLAPALATLDNARVDACGFACTATTYLVGDAREAAVFDALAAARGHPVVSAASAIRAALQALQVRRLALLSPYPSWLRASCEDWVRRQGIDLVDARGLPGDRSDTRRIYALRAADLVAGLEALRWQGADAVLVSGTGAPTLALLAGHGLPLPVIGSNLCLAWALERRLAGAPLDAASLQARLADPRWRDELARRYPLAQSELCAGRVAPPAAAPTDS